MKNVNFANNSEPKRWTVSTSIRGTPRGLHGPNGRENAIDYARGRFGGSRGEMFRILQGRGDRAHLGSDRLKHRATAFGTSTMAFEECFQFFRAPVCRF